MNSNLKEICRKSAGAIKRVTVFLWRQKMLVPAVLMGVFVCVSLYSYKKPEFQRPDTVVAAEQEESQDASEEAVTGDGFDLEDGTYQGSGTGYGGTVTVEVTIKDGKIVSISILSAPGEGESFLNRAKGVIDSIIQQQSTDVDVVSGATYSSRGIIEAVKNALTGEKSTSTVAAAASSAQAGSPGSLGTVDENQTYKDGTYTGSAQGFGGIIQVQVVIKSGKIKSVKILSASGETPSYLSKAKQLLNTIVKKQSTNVDAVSGATYSSNGIIKAVRNALAKAKDSGSSSKKKTSSKSSSSKQAASGKLPYPDGVYYGTGEGFAGDITVAITIRDHTLKAAVITESSDDASFLKKAKSILDEVVNKQSANVDVVSGATYSSKGIIQAVKNALKAAKKAAAGTVDPDKDDAGKDDNTDSGGDAEEGTIYKNGTYTGSAICDGGDAFYYKMEVKITVETDKITAVEVLDGTDEDWLDNESYIKRAKNGMIKKIISNGLPEGVDAVSGATYSSNAIVSACQQALAKAKR